MHFSSILSKLKLFISVSVFAQTTKHKKKYIVGLKNDITGRTTSKYLVGQIPKIRASIFLGTFLRLFLFQNGS